MDLVLISSDSEKSLACKMFDTIKLIKIDLKAK